MTRRYLIHGDEDLSIDNKKDFIEIDSLNLDEDLKVYKVVEKTTKKINLGGGAKQDGNRVSGM